MAATERARLSRDLALSGFGLLPGGLLVHPAAYNARSAWDLASLERRYRRFVQQFASLLPMMTRQDSISPSTGFLVRILLIHKYRRIHLRDPLLPSSMLPNDWVGSDAHEMCRALYARSLAPAEAFVSSAVRNADGPLPPAEKSIWRRFGGAPIRR